MDTIRHSGKKLSITGAQEKVREAETLSLEDERPRCHGKLVKAWAEYLQAKVRPRLCWFFANAMRVRIYMHSVTVSCCVVGTLRCIGTS